MELIEQRFEEHLRAVQKVRKSKKLMKEIAFAAAMMRVALASGHKIMFCGNGSSAADCQRWAAEIVSRYQKIRNGLPALALTADSAVLTAIANDYGYDRIFTRQVEALGNKGDLLVAVSTSGNSANVLAGIEEAKSIGIKTIGMTAAGGGKMAEICDICLIMPEKAEARVEELFSLIGHIFCEIIDE